MSGKYFFIVSLFIVSLFTSPVFGGSEQQRLIDLVNQYRTENKQPAIPTSYWLTATAMLHTIDRRDNGYPESYGCSSGHSWSGKSTLFTGPCCYSGATNWECMGLKPAEISKNRFTGIGYENWVQADSVEAALAAWKGSTAHREVILNLNGWAGSPWKSIGAGVCGGFYGIWFSQTADPDSTGDIDLLTCSIKANGPVPAPVARVANASPVPSPSAAASITSKPSESSTPSKSAEPSDSSVPSKSSSPSVTSKPSMTSTPSKSSEPSESSVPSATSTHTMTKSPSISSVPSSSASNSPAPQSPKLWVGGLTVSDTTWRTITMNKTFDEPVIVCSLYYTKYQNPLSVRVKNVIDGGNTFDLQISGALSGSVDVNCVAIESGIYTLAENGVTIEAKRILSTVTNSKNQWSSGTSITFENTYTNPVVLGQVMSANDPKWSIFYARGSANSSATIPSGAKNCVIGKQVGEDTNTVRADEVLGYIVIEAGTGNWGDRQYEAIKGSSSIYGIGNTSPSYTYNLSGKVAVSFGVNSVNSVIGTDGGYSIFYVDQTTAYANNQIALAIDEDSIGDSERIHSSGESVGVLLFD